MKKGLALFLSAAMIFALAGCDLATSKSKKSSSIDEDDVIELAEKFGDALKSQKAKNLTKICEDDDELEELFEKVIMSSEVSDDIKDAHDAIVNTLEYEVDEDSVEESKKGATVELTVSVKDYEKVNVDYCYYVEDFIDELDDVSKTKDISVELEIEEDDGDLIITNAADILEDIYVWEDFEPYFGTLVDESIATEPEETTEPVVEEITEFAQAYDGTVFFYDGESYNAGYTYENTVYVECDLVVVPGCEDLDWESLTCEIYYEGELVRDMKLSTTEDGGVFYAYAITGILDLPELSDPDHFYLVDGEYTFRFYEPNGDYLTENTCYVEYVEYDYDFSVKAGDSPDVDYIHFADFYLIDPAGAEIDLYTLDPQHVFTYTFVFEKDGKVLYDSTEDYPNGYVDSGLFIMAWLEPQDCGWDELETGTYTVTFYDMDGKVIVTSDFVVE